MPQDEVKLRLLGHTSKERAQYGKGKDIGARAKRDKNGDCIEYKESLYKHFMRLGKLFAPGPDQKVNPPVDLNIYLAVELYGLSKQGIYGNIKKPKPAWYEIEDTILWESWNDLKGMKPV